MPCRIELFNNWTAAAPAFAKLTAQGVSLPFQQRDWLDAWYRHPGGELGVEALPIVVHVDGVPAMALPLVRRCRGALVHVEFADGGLTDYNAPILGAAAPDTPAAAAEVFRALRAALRGVDVIDLARMPSAVKGRVNPLALLPGVRSSALAGNLIHIDGSWDRWHHSFDRRYRKELERIWRVFTRHEGAEFRQLGPGPEAQEVYDRLTVLQRERLAVQGIPYVLDHPAKAGFYRDLLALGLASGTVILTALLVRGEVVAALYSVGDGEHLFMLRLSAAGGEWTKCSPGRLMIERTMHALFARSYRTFDFTLGDYEYKRRMGVTPVPLVDLRVWTSLKGVLPVALGRLHARARRSPRLRAAVRRLRGRA